jgi:hypothetical protein
VLDPVGGEPGLADLQRGGRHELALEIAHTLDLGPNVEEPIGPVCRRGDHRDVACAAAKRQQEWIELPGPELHLAGDQHLCRLRRVLEHHRLAVEAFRFEESLVHGDVEIPGDCVAGQVAHGQRLERLRHRGWRGGNIERNGRKQQRSDTVADPIRFHSPAFPDAPERLA